MDNPRRRKGPLELGFPGKLHAWHVDTYETHKIDGVGYLMHKLVPRRPLCYSLHSS